MMLPKGNPKIALSTRHHAENYRNEAESPEEEAQSTSSVGPIVEITERESGDYP
jgi:hypothetical protein